MLTSRRWPTHYSQHIIVAGKLLQRHFYVQLCIVLSCSQRCQSWGLGLGGRDTPDFGQGGRRVGRMGARGGREILLYLIMYRKYVRLLKRNRILFPDLAVNQQFLPGK